MAAPEKEPGAHGTHARVSASSCVPAPQGASAAEDAMTRKIANTVPTTNRLAPLVRLIGLLSKSSGAAAAAAGVSAATTGAAPGTTAVACPAAGAAIAASRKRACTLSAQAPRAARSLTRKAASMKTTKNKLATKTKSEIPSAGEAPRASLCAYGPFHATCTITKSVASAMARSVTFMGRKETKGPGTKIAAA